jgi:hypothetical protein
MKKSEVIGMLDKFTSGYIGCALWAENEDDHNVSAITMESLLAMIDDCRKFQDENEAALSVYCEHFGMDYAGHDFWLTRNHHGAGFWDRPRNHQFTLRRACD